MQQSTIFAILMILLDKRKVSREYLAERFSVSERTITRYITVLADAGVPVRSTKGIGGGISLADDFTVDKTFFSEAETMRLADALEKTMGLYPDNVNRALIEKLYAVRKSRMRDTRTVDRDDLYIDCDYEQAAAIKSKLALFGDAIEKRQATEIIYTDANGYDSYRTIEPYTLVFKNGAWYVYAMCRLRGDFRLFKLTRINDARITSKSFIRYESKLAEKLELEYYNEVFTDIEFEFFPAVREAVADWLGRDAITERGAKLYAVAEVPYNDATYRKLLSFGSSIKVVQPRELAQKLKEDARLMLDIYGSDG